MHHESSAVAVIFAGGDAPEPGVLDQITARIGGDALLVAADSGLGHARAAGLVVDVVVGDLDSVDPADLDAAIAEGATVERHPTDKDATDLELAVESARSRGARRIVVVGAGGGRLDHFLANALLLGAPGFADLDIEARIGPASATVVRPRAGVELHGRPGDLLTLLPLGGPARGVRTGGLRWALHDETLLPGSSRGVSNVFDVPTATVSLDDGVLLAVQPGTAERPTPPR